MKREIGEKTEEKGDVSAAEPRTERSAAEHKEPAERRGRKTAIVVGGSSGIGKETALKLHAGSYRVFNLSRTPFAGDRIESRTADAAQEGELGREITAIAEEYGLDLLVYSAGFSMAAPLEHAKSGDYRYLFEVNYFGAIEAIQAAAPYLKKREGRIILVGSMGGEVPIPFDGFYSSSKAALCMLAREADMELRPCGVRVSALLPGGTSTDFTYSRRVYGADESKGYVSSVKKASAALANMEQGGMTPSLVADCVVKLAAKRNPPTVSAAGGKNSFLRYAGRVLPERFTDWLVRKKFNQK